ncbi:2-oxoacid:ferredoxin oxidoreductase subunit beta [Mariprofundus sp. EBB-1]|uniref:thiamine pyrophosphate-dependent enzyme n=1 Tax=Mariprofundus sp. EBB-1 TaxID=2650971 RepID=UPI000EF185DE|nr:thiamine pyrophosphate-dependent enzyme [Mariprofundus sp. EBB-1]RLL51320.1 2-oxoacid:ferredoxin oxidoreductase subunit beta [Mariprofundus sp. EBB-1]
MRERMKPKDYKSGIPPVWCAGCGNYGALSAIYRALAALQIDPANLVNVSGIGCSSRMPYFLKAYKMHTLHGRAGPIATGLQLARPDLKVLVTGGDGDGFSIGGGHMPHLGRSNVNLTYVLMDNHIYGLTKGQFSPTSRREMKSYTTPYGGIEEPMRPLLYMLTYGASYVAQAYAGNAIMSAELIKGGLEHQGMAYIHLLSQCPTFNKMDTADYFKSIIKEIPASHDTSDLRKAMRLIYKFKDKEPVGLLYQTRRPTLDECMAGLVEQAGGSKEYDIHKIIDLARP